MDEIAERLKSLGYAEVSDEDELLLGFIVDKITNKIISECNVNEIPAPLHPVWLDMVCGEFLFAKKQSGKLEEYDFEAVEKQIQEGDTSITFAIGEGDMTPEQRLDSLIAHLMNSGNGQFAAYRRLKW